MTRVNLSSRLKNAKPVSTDLVHLDACSAKVIYLEKNDIKPFLGTVYSGEIYIQHGLPKIVSRSVLTHESFHLSHYHPDESYWLGELQANLYAMWRDPFAWLCCLLYSLRPARIMLYARLFMKSNRYSA